MTNPVSHQTISAADAAKALGISESMLAKLRLFGGGPIYCKLGRRVVYRPDDLVTWLDSRKRQSTSESAGRAGRA